MRNRRFRSITTGAGLAVLLLSLVVATPSRAAEPAFPPGSRIGLVPPTGMVISDAFAGFADPEKNAAILIATLPAAAYSQLDKTLDTEELRKQGISLEKREPMRLDAGKGFLLTGRQVAGKERYRKWLLVLAAGDITALVSVQIPESDTAYPNNIVRTALATLAVRQKVPEQEQLGLLPFTVGDLAGFRVDAVLPGRALVLSAAAAETPKDASKESEEAPKEPKEAKDSKDAAKETSKEASKAPKEAKDSKEAAKDSSKEAAARSFDARLLIAAAPGGPAEADDRGSFARTSFAEIGGMQGCPHHDVGAAAHRRTIGISDHGGSQGHAQRSRFDGGAMAAFRQRRVSADDRDRTRRRMDQHALAAARRPRQRSAEVSPAIQAAARANAPNTPYCAKPGIGLE